MPGYPLMPATDRRVLLVSHRPLEAGGTTRWRHLARALPEHGWSVHAVTPTAGATTDRSSSDERIARRSEVRARVMERAGAVSRPVANRVLGVQPEAFPPNTLWAFTGRPSIRRAIAEHRPDVVVATSPPPAALFAAAAVTDGLPFVADLRDPWAGSPFYDAGGRLLRAIERRTLDRADAIVAVTAPMLDELRARHPALAGRMLMLPNGFPPGLLAGRPAAAPDWSGRPVTLIHPGTLYGGRSLAALVRALDAPELRDRVRLRLLGNADPDTEAAMAACPRVATEVRPPVPWEAAIEEVRAADIVVVAQPTALGDEIAWPVKTFEALALGKPVLALTGGGAVERLLGELGVDAGCARHGDPESVAAAVRRLLDRPPAPVPAERLAPWDRAVVAGDYAALLNEVSAGRRLSSSER